MVESKAFSFIPCLKKIVAKVERGNEANGWAGLDDFYFYHEFPDCEIEPSEAKPEIPTTTQPPPGMFYLWYNTFSKFLLISINFDLISIKS